MALGKTVSYTPFNETSFAYGSNEIATAHITEFPDADSIVKVTISWLSGNWDNTTGHLSTPSVGTAVAVYNKVKKEWYVKGERDDVDAVLAAMSFFPADKAETRTWTPTVLKSNLTSGNYGSTEEPPTIGDTNFTVRVYDGATQVSTQTLTFNVTEAVFGNQRPYFSVAPTVEDLNTTEHDSSVGGLLNLGTISHGSDTENVQVTCEFRKWNEYMFIVDEWGEDIITSSSFGYLTQDENIYIGDKKPSQSDNNEARFDFTGSLAEAQAFLDNVRYSNNGNETTFDMFLTITDGVVGSRLKKTCYFSDALITATTIPDQSFIEDGESWQDFGIVTFGNIQPDVTQYSCTVTFDATGHSGISHGYFGTGTYVDGQPLTTTRSTLAELQQDLRLLELYMVQDFDTSYTLTVDFTFSNPTLGTSYTATQQTINVSGIPTEEISNPTTTHTWTEDQRYDFPNSKTPQIIHPQNSYFDVIFTLSDVDAGVLYRHGTNAFFTNAFGTSTQYKLTGTRDEVNLALQNLYFVPKVDYDDDFTISFTVDRTSGDLTYATQQTGSFTMNAIAVSEFSFPLVLPEIKWENNVSTEFETGLRITDGASTLVDSPTFGSTYTVNARLRSFGQQFPHAVVRLQDNDIESLNSVTGDRSNDLTFSGSLNAVNSALNNFILIPNPKFEELHEFFLLYEITRDADGVKILNPSANVRTLFNNPTITAPYYVNTPLFDWEEDKPFEFDSQFRITENLTANSDYTPANGYDSWYGSKYRVTLNGSQGATLPEIKFATKHTNLDTISGVGTYADPLILEGYRDEINKAFAVMTITPTVPDFTTSALDNGGFWVEAQVKRLRDNSNILNYNERLANFNAGTDTPEYLTSWTNVIYYEDLKGRRIFAHLDDFIEDGAGDLFDTTYDVTIGLDNETTGKFVPYVNDDYLVDDDINIFVDDYEVRLVGTKAEINEAIKQIQFTPLADVYANVDIRYTQKRTFNNTTVTHADNVVVATMVGINAPETILGSANNNIQYFVSDQFKKGLSTSSLHNAEPNWADNSDFFGDFNSNYNLVTLDAHQLSANLNKVYDIPITIADTFEDTGASSYKFVIAGGGLIDLGVSFAPGFLTSNSWFSKNTINSSQRQASQFMPINIPTDIDNAPFHNEEFDLIIDVYRKSHSGVEAHIDTVTLTYKFLSGMTLNAYDEDGEYRFGKPTELIRIDDIDWKSRVDIRAEMLALRANYPELTSYQELLDNINGYAELAAELDAVNQILYRKLNSAYVYDGKVVIADERGSNINDFASNVRAVFFPIDYRYVRSSNDTLSSSNIKYLPRTITVSGTDGVSQIKPDIYFRERDFTFPEYFPKPPNYTHYTYGRYYTHPRSTFEWWKRREIIYKTYQTPKEIGAECEFVSQDNLKGVTYGVYAWTTWGTIMRFGAGWHNTTGNTGTGVYQPLITDSSNNTSRPSHFPIGISVNHNSYAP